MKTEITPPTDGRPIHTMRMRVRHHEVVHLHVNHAVYLHYLEEATQEHNEALGLSIKHLADELGGLFMVRHHDITYQGAATFGDWLTVTTWVDEVSGPRLVRGYAIHHEESSLLLVAARTTWVFVALESNRPLRVPGVVHDRVLPRARHEPPCEGQGTPVRVLNGP